MCKPQAEGGQRCASHTRKEYQRVTKRLAWVQANSPFIDVEDSWKQKWETAAIAYASTDEGAAEITRLRDEAAAARAHYRAAELQSVLDRGANLRAANREAKERLKAAAAKAAPAPTPEPVPVPSEDEGYRGGHQAPTDTVFLHNLTGPEGTFPGDVYDHPDYYTFGGDEPYERESVAVIRRVRNNPDAEVTIYRAAPPGVSSINSGDWVTLSESYARQHAIQDDDEANDWPVYAITVKARDIRSGGNDLIEWGFHGQSTNSTVVPRH